MSNIEAAALLVKLYGEYRRGNTQSSEYEHAIAIACQALQGGEARCQRKQE